MSFLIEDPRKDTSFVAIWRIDILTTVASRTFCADLRSYEAQAIGEIPITSNDWNSGIGKRCFQIKLPTRGTELILEIQAEWANRREVSGVRKRRSKWYGTSIAGV